MADGDRYKQSEEDIRKLFARLYALFPNISPMR